MMGKPTRKVGSRTIAHTCPKCGQHEAGMTDSRPTTAPEVWRRRRYKCFACLHSWATHEMIIDDIDHGALAMQVRVKMFLRDVERAAREAFGNDAGHLVHSNSMKRSDQS